MIEAEKLRIGQFNLLNLNAPNIPFYQSSTGYSQAEVTAKITWTASQLQRMNCSVVAFEEVFDINTLRLAVDKAGYPPGTHLISTPTNCLSPAVALLSTHKIISWEVIENFPPEAILIMPDLSGGSSNGGKATGNKTLIPIDKFNKPPTIELPSGHLITVFAVHLKSKRPMTKPSERFDSKSKALGHALSLLIRGAEAAALRCLLIDELNCINKNSDDDDRQEVDDEIFQFEDQQNAGRRNSKNHNRNLTAGYSLSRNFRSPSPSPMKNNHSRWGSKKAAERPPENPPTVIVLGDLNDTASSVSTEIITGTKPWKKCTIEEKELTWSTMLHPANEVQVRNSDRDVTYSHIHNGHYEVLDHILVSNNLVRYNPKHIGYVQWVQYFNDHIYDETLVDDDDDTQGPLGEELVAEGQTTVITSPKPKLRDGVNSDSDEEWDYDHPFGPPSAGNGGFRKEVRKGRGLKKKRDFIKSDHGTVVAMIKIWPQGQRPPKESRQY